MCTVCLNSGRFWQKTATVRSRSDGSGGVRQDRSDGSGGVRQDFGPLDNISLMKSPYSRYNG